MAKKNLPRWESLRKLLNVRDDMNRVFARNREAAEEFWIPVIDIIEDSDNFIVKAELPGVKKDAIKISIRSTILTISGIRVQENETKKRTFHRLERSLGTFMRAITLPAELNSDAVKATLKNGILVITLPKPESMKQKEMSVEVT